jgi:flagellar biosynthesis protein FliR
LEYFILNFQKFMLVFVRIMGMFLVAPIFSSESISVRAKFGLMFFTTIVIFPLTSSFVPDIPNNVIEYGLIAAVEGLIGAMLGFCIDLAFNVYQLAGQFFTVQMGLGASEVFDPLSEISLPLMGQYLYLIAIMVFLNLRGPALMIQEIYLSFEMINAESFLNGSLLESKYGLITLFGKMFLVALKLSFPVVGALLIVSIAMGLLTKAAPQMNLLMIGFPVTIMITFVLLLFLLPSILNFFQNYVDEVFKDIWLLMRDLYGSVKH